MSKREEFGLGFFVEVDTDGHVTVGNRRDGCYADIVGDEDGEDAILYCDQGLCVPDAVLAAYLRARGWKVDAPVTPADARPVAAGEE